jgi:dihydrofolate synthase/folylpolyglutamate synthase
MDVFFSEWDSRKIGERRSLARAGLLRDALGLAPVGIPLLTVVGSKGKGTAAAYASACLAAAGLRTITITSPSYRTVRERIRLDGAAVPPEALDRLAARLAGAIGRLPARNDGYLSPSGLFTLAGIGFAVDVGADAIVLEAGRGGRSDEASLFPPDVVAVTPVFGEHLGVLGDTVEEIAQDKAGVIAPTTRAVVSAPQTPSVAAVFAEACEEVQWVAEPQVPAEVLPPGLGRVNAEVGCVAAGHLGGRVVRRVLESVVLPGRLSFHRFDGVELLLDQAVNGAGAAAALAEARRRWGGIDHVLVSLSDDKDLDGVARELLGLPVTFVELERSHLSFGRPLPRDWARVKEADLDLRVGARVLALGTFSFVGAVLELIGHPTERIFQPS